MLIFIYFFAGGNTDYFVDNITDFHMRHSVFDLAIMAAVKVILIVTILPALENTSFKQLEDPYSSELQNRATTLHILLILSSVVFVAYSATKGGLILYAVLQESHYVRMHVEYNALAISAFCFSILQFVMTLFSFRSMRQLKVIRILHRFNDLGQEIDKDGNPVKKSVNLKRLASLAKPVSIIKCCPCKIRASETTKHLRKLYMPPH